MAIITFSKATPFPTTPFPAGALRELLNTHLPAYKWQCGEHDSGGKAEIGRFHEHMLISGRSTDTIVFTELRAVDAVMPGSAPPHLWHLNIGAPTTEVDVGSARLRGDDLGGEKLLLPAATGVGDALQRPVGRLRRRRHRRRVRPGAREPVVLPARVPQAGRPGVGVWADRRAGIRQCDDRRRVA